MDTSSQRIPLLSLPSCGRRRGVRPKTGMIRNWKPSVSRESRQEKVPSHLFPPSPPQVVAQALADAGVSVSQLSAVAVTVGPGLSLCLRGHPPPTLPPVASERPRMSCGRTTQKVPGRRLKDHLWHLCHSLCARWHDSDDGWDVGWGAG